MITCYMDKLLQLEFINEESTGNSSVALEEHFEDIYDSFQIQKYDGLISASLTSRLNRLYFGIPPHQISDDLCGKPITNARLIEKYFSTFSVFALMMVTTKYQSHVNKRQIIRFYELITTIIAQKHENILVNNYNL